MSDHNKDRAPANTRADASTYATENLHGLTGAYALNAMNDVERAAFEKHLRECDDCSVEVASLREAPVWLAGTTTAHAPASLRDAALAQARVTPQVSRRRGRSGDGQPRFRRTAVAWIGAAAASALVIAGVGIATLNAEAPEPLTLAEQAIEYMGAEDAQKSVMPWGNSYVVVSESKGGALLMCEEIYVPWRGSVYQLWMVHEDGTVEPSITFMPNEDGSVMAFVDGDMGSVVELAITSEPFGGSAAPTGDMLAVATV